MGPARSLNRDMRHTEIEGTDYFTGAEIPVSELNLLTKEADSEYEKKFVEFAAVFCHEYGVASNAISPVLLSDDSLRMVRRYYDSGMKLR